VPVRRCGDVVDVDVHTIDNWTLTPSIAFGSAGGVERYSVEVQDMNVLGLGKELLFRVSRSGEEHESRFVYGDDNVLGGPHRLRLEVGDTEDGERYEVSAGLPFRTASSSASWWLSALSETDSFKLAPDAPQVSTVDTLSAAALVDTERFDLGVAAALSRSTFDVARAGAGFRIERQITRLPVGLYEAAKRTDFEEAYPYLQASWAQRKWTERSNYLGIGRIEDIDTGIGVHIEAGLLLEALGNGRDQLRFSAELAKAWHVGEDALHRLTLGGTRYVGAATDPNAPLARHAASIRYQYFRWLGERDQLDLRLVVEQHRGRSPVEDFRLGGEHGLKGYPNAYRRGSTRFVAVGEYRHVMPWTPLALAKVAFSAFAEVGRAGVNETERETLADAGIGVMFSPTRSSRNDIVRFDIAVPLVDGPGVERYLFFVGSRLTY